MTAVLRRMVLSGGVALLLAGPALAEERKAEPAPQPGSPSVEMSDGEVRKIDLDNGKITVRHGEIRNLDMPPMTMVFQVKDRALINTVKVGEKIKFRAEKSGTAFVIVALEKTE